MFKTNNKPLPKLNIDKPEKKSTKDFISFLKLLEGNIETAAINKYPELPPVIAVSEYLDEFFKSDKKESE